MPGGARGPDRRSAPGRLTRPPTRARLAARTPTQGGTRTCSPVSAAAVRRPPSSSRCIALFVALGGVSYGVATGSIDGREVKNSSLTGSDVRNSSLTGSDVRGSSLTGSDVRNGSLGAATSRPGRCRPDRRAPRRQGRMASAAELLLGRHDRAATGASRRRSRTARRGRTPPAATRTSSGTTRTRRRSSQRGDSRAGLLRAGTPRRLVRDPGCERERVRRLAVVEAICANANSIDGGVTPQSAGRKAKKRR